MLVYIFALDTFADSGSRLPAHKLEQFCVHLLDLYKSSACWQHCNGSVDLLNYLRMQQQLAKSQKKPTFSMGIISNFDPRLSTLLSNMKIAHYFDFIINSYDSNVEKPDGKIFKLAINQSDVENLKPFECLHVGDGPITDYLAAKNQGWNTALIHEKNYAYLLHKYGDRIEEHLVFPSLYDFHKKLSNNCIEW